MTVRQSTLRRSAAACRRVSAPGAAPLEFTGEFKPLEAMTKFAVLDEPRMSSTWVFNIDRAVQWLGDNGFERLDGEKLPLWMRERIDKQDAYGSVVVLPRGKSPVGMFEGPVDNPLWLAYLKAGGRIVHAGNIPFHYVESPTVEPVAPMASPKQLGRMYRKPLRYGSSGTRLG